MTKLTGKICPKCGLTAESYKPASRHLPCGTMLAERYYIGRVIGEGGFGITYMGFDVILERKVAIKEYFPSAWAIRYNEQSLNIVCNTSSEESYNKGKDRFIQEARAMAKMNKQKEIADVEDFFEKNGTAYIVMEYVDGITLKARVQNQGAMLPNELFELMYPIMDTLQVMHDKGLIHRDISPDNLMIEKGSLRLIDFGCARENISGDESMTIMHKQGFSPAEQYQKKGQGPWTDVYALAATIYYCITGKVPPQAIDRLMGDTLIKPTDMGIEISPAQEEALLMGMAVRKQDRFQSVSAFRAALSSAPKYSMDLTDSEGVPLKGATETADTAGLSGSKNILKTEAEAKTGEDTDAARKMQQTGQTDTLDQQPVGKTVFAGETSGQTDQKEAAQDETASSTEQGADSADNVNSKKKLPKSIMTVIAAAAVIVIILIIVLVVKLAGKTDDEPVTTAQTETETEALVVEWDYEEGVLTISGNGPMDDYEEASAPWYSYAEEIKTVVIEGGITSIGAYSFCDCTALSFVSIPATVTSIEESAFESCQSLEEISLPDSVTEIGAYAFYDCSSLISVNLPEGLTALSIGTFAYCTELETITIPDTVTGIGNYCFYFCYSLSEMVIPENVKVIGEEVFAFCTGIEYIETDSGNEYFVSEDGVLFSADMETLIAYPGGNTDTEEYDIPDSVTVIKAGAFEGNDWLEIINIPAGVEEIGDNAFAVGWFFEEINVDSDNSNYSSKDGVLFNKTKTELIMYPADKSGTSYEIPDTVQVICESSFYFNMNLEEIIIPESVTEIGDYVFYYTYSLTDIKYIGSEDEWNAITISDYNSISDYCVTYNYVAEEETEASASDMSESAASASSTTSTTAATTAETTAAAAVNATATALEGTKGANSSELYGNLLDGSVYTKWCVTSFSSAYIIWEMSEAVAITGYKISTANDNSTYTGRNPTSWALYGANGSSAPSKDSSSWKLITSVSGNTTLQAVNYTTYTFTLSSRAASYKYYKLVITAVKSGSVMQMSEFTLVY